jgi:hypothetical protein
VLLDTDTAQVVTLAAAGVSVLAVGFSAAALTRIRKLTAAHDILTGGDNRATFVESVTLQHREIEGMRTDVGHLREDLAAARADLSDALRHVAVVRYDAFGDMGGRLSFSAALLDDAGDGIVLTSINGRSETRTYAKGVKAGDSDHSLSPEEAQAISYATRATVQPREAPDGEPARRGRFSRR